MKFSTWIVLALSALLVAGALVVIELRKPQEFVLGPGQPVPFATFRATEPAPATGPLASDPIRLVEEGSCLFSVVELRSFELARSLVVLPEGEARLHRTPDPPGAPVISIGESNPRVFRFEELSGVDHFNSAFRRIDEPESWPGDLVNEWDPTCEESGVEFVLFLRGDNLE